MNSLKDCLPIVGSSWRMAILGDTQVDSSELPSRRIEPPLFLPNKEYSSLVSSDWVIHPKGVSVLIQSDQRRETGKILREFSETLRAHVVTEIEGAFFKIDNYFYISPENFSCSSLSEDNMISILCHFDSRWFEKSFQKKSNSITGDLVVEKTEHSTFWLHWIMNAYRPLGWCSILS